MNIPQPPPPRKETSPSALKKTNRHATYLLKAAMPEIQHEQFCSFNGMGKWEIEFN